MFKGLIGKKIGMTQIFDESGAALPVTLIEAGPCFVTQVRRVETEGYSAVQLGLGEVKPKRLTGGQLGHLKRTNLPPLRFIREFRAKEIQVNEGDKVDVSIFALGEKVDVSGVSKGKGFAGGVKRYHFRGGPKTHGQSDRALAPGSIGQGTSPGRVHKQKKMAGHYGQTQFAVENLTIIKIDSTTNEVWVNGPIPGANQGIVEIKFTKNGTFEGLNEETKVV